MLLNGRLCKEATEILDFKEFTRTLCNTLLYFPLLNICKKIIKKNHVKNYNEIPILNENKVKELV